jgi:hypothetical protein
MMMMGMNKSNDGNSSGLSEKLIAILLEKLFDDSNGNGNGKSDDLMKFMLAQNMQTQQLMMSMINNKNNNQVPQVNPYLDGMVALLKSQAEMGNSVVLDKIKELEMRSQGVDSLGEAKRVLDYMSSFKHLLGGSNSTPEVLAHEKDMKILDYERERQLKEEDLKDKRMGQIGDMLNTSIKTFADMISKPAAEAIKTKIEGMGKTPVPSSVGVPREILNKEIDLGDLNMSEANPTIPEADLQLQEQAKVGQRSDRFRVIKAI